MSDRAYHHGQPPHELIGRGRNDRDRSSLAEAQALRGSMRAIAGVAMIEASNRSSDSIEAEHVLLAFLFDKKSPAHDVLAAHGLTYEAFDRALKTERERSLAAAGVTLPDPARLAATPRNHSRIRFGTSAREALERTMRRVRTQRRGRDTVSHTDFVIGILSAELGTVPRALAHAGFDRDAIVAALEEQTSRKDSK